MSKVAIVFWSGSGNTEAMAFAIEEGVKQSGAEAVVKQVSEFSPDTVSDYQAVIFGCPAMGAEELEDSEFEPVFAACEAKLSGLPVALFGSYGWGSGEWMSTWQARTEATGAKVVGTVIAQNAPEDDAIAECQKLGSDVVAAI